MAKKSNTKIRQLHALQKKNTERNRWLAEDATIKMPKPEELQQRLMDSGVEFALATQIVTEISPEMGGETIAHAVIRGTARYSQGRDAASCKVLNEFMPKIIKVLVGDFYPDILSEANKTLDAFRKAALG